MNSPNPLKAKESKTIFFSYIKEVGKCFKTRSYKKNPDAQLRIHNLPGQPGPGLHHPQREEVLPHAQLELPLLQFVPVAPCPVAAHHWKESGPVLLTPTLQIFRGISKILSQPSLLQAEQAQLPQPLLAGEMRRITKVIPYLTVCTTAKLYGDNIVQQTTLWRCKRGLKTERDNSTPTCKRQN